MPNANYELVPGMYASVEIPLHTVTNVLTVPMQAVQSTGTGQGHRAGRECLATTWKSANVTLGLQTATEVEVAVRPQENDTVVFGEQRSVQSRPAGLAETRRSPGNGVDPKMPSFSIRHPYLIIVICLFVCVLGITSLVQMPVDMFPPINIPVVLVATFYSGMPPQQIEADITDTFERFFTLGSGIDHMESRSMTGVSLIKIYFQPGTDANADVTQISNLAMADLRRLPQGTLPPVVMKVDASSLPVCLLTVEGQGLNETQLHDYLQYQIRNQIAGVPGATVPPPYGGKYRQIMVYVDPLKLQAHELSPMDVVRATDESNLILPAGDVRIGPMDYNIYTNAQVPNAEALNEIPLKTEGQKSVFLSDVGKAVDGSALQYNIVRVNGQKSVYVPIQKQGGDTNTIAVVNGIKKAITRLARHSGAAEDARRFRPIGFRQAGHFHRACAKAASGLLLTAVMILMFLGSLRATAAVFLSIPLSVMIAFFVLHSGGKTINSMVLSGLALAFSRLIDDSVVVIENIFRHIELGEDPESGRRERGANEVALAVLAIMLVAVVVFFPVTLLFGVSKYLFYGAGARAWSSRSCLLLCRRHRGSAVLRDIS